MHNQDTVVSAHGQVKLLKEDMPRHYFFTERQQKRFWRFVNKDNECWVWTGSISDSGYGQFSVSIKYRSFTFRVHRWSFELVNGPIDKGMTLDHLCRNRACVNPAHLEQVTQQVNTYRGTNQCALNKRKTHCKSGHEFTPENTYYYDKRPGRLCKKCRAISCAKWRANSLDNQR